MKKHTSFKIQSAQRGFTLVEIVIVIALIGIIMGVVAANVFGNKERSYYKLTETQLTTLSAKIETYEMDTGNLPGQLQDLVSAPGSASGWLGPYTKEKDLKDAWGTAIEYRSPGASSKFELVSLGADRKPGGEGVDADIRVQPQ
ncbi:MAG: type II secretion system major pseudopilin GspG [Xanthomonadales bacterium]|nr:type II secretion system major pseudopilin GspG [Xanthomonadales bacterium]